MSSAGPVRIDAKTLRELVGGSVAAAGAPAPEAAALADSLVDASLRGVDSHGVNLLPEYLRRIAAGGWTMPNPARIVRAEAATVLVDGGGGLGAITAEFAMGEAIERAQRHGIAAVSVVGGSHFGAAGYWARMALGRELIGLVFTNASPGMAPYGGIDKLLSNNPWSIAVPSNEEFDVVLDIANSVVARSWIRLAAKAGRDIPLGWAITAEGMPTTDPHQALAGTLLPIAGHKGYGIAFIVDVLTGILAGASFGPDVGSPFPISLRETTARDEDYRPQNVGQLFLAIKVAAFRPVAYFKADVSALIARLRLSRPAPGVDRVRVPGEPEHEKSLERRRTGIPVSPEVLDVLPAWPTGTSS